MGSQTTARRRRLPATLTVPNSLSVLRLLGVPLFLWLVLGPHADAWALLVMALAGFTDWLDGQLARAWRQTSRLGELLDPTADRLYILAVLAGLGAREIIPLGFAAFLVLRDVVLVSCGPVLRRHGYGILPVHFLGKAATFNLLYGFPLLLLGGEGGLLGAVAKVVGWAFVIWGAALHWWAGVLYVLQVRQLVRGGEEAGGETRPAALAADGEEASATVSPREPPERHASDAAGEGGRRG